MRHRTPEPDSFTKSIRYAALTLVFCALNVVELAHAKFALLTLSELHAYWIGRYGHFPFTALPWSERHFGGDALAMRLPELLLFAVLLAVVLWWLNGLVRGLQPLTLVTGTLVLLAALAVQQYFALKSLRRERREFSVLLSRVERATAPGEIVAAEWNLAIPLYAYGSDALRAQLRSTPHSSPDIPPVRSYTPAGAQEEMVYVGSARDSFAQSEFLARGFVVREADTAPVAGMKEVADYYHVAEIRIYFASPAAATSTAKPDGGAVLSKP